MVNSKISLPKHINFLIAINLVLIALSLIVIQKTNLDLFLQSYLFDAENKQWLIDRDEPVKRFFLYQFPKILFGVFVVISLALVLISFKRKTSKFHKNRHVFLLIFLGLSLIPLIAGNIKTFTNVYCPTQLDIYDGDKPYVRIFDSYPDSFVQNKAGKCFPAGHCVTGFALFILFFALVGKARIFGLILPLILGWVLGFYQMAKGAHFFGDTLVSMLVCFLLAAVISKIYTSRLQKISC